MVLFRIYATKQDLTCMYFYFLKKLAFKIYAYNIWIHMFSILYVQFQHFHIKILN